MINVSQIKGNSFYDVQARNYPDNEQLITEVVEQYRDAGGESKDHLLLIFGKQNLIKMHEAYLNFAYGSSDNS